MNATATATATDPPGCRRGQILIMFALFSTALLGVLGLAIDLGVSFSGRRSMQNAADLGALAGARAVLRAVDEPLRRAGTDVAAVVAGNGFALSTGVAVEECAYVDDAGTGLGSCALPVLPTATGVRVTVAETHPTFFIRVVPGAPTSVTTRAGATAHVQRLAAPPRDGPFLVCGVNTRLSTGAPLSILLDAGGGTWTLNPAAVNQTFVVHGPLVATCNAQSSRFKGVADQAANKTRAVPGWLGYKEGDGAGPISTDVHGIQGCKAGGATVNCVLYLPIIVPDPRERNNDRQVWGITFLPFYVTEPKSNEHHGKLLSGYLSFDPGAPGWRRTVPGPAVVHLTT